MVYQDKSLTCSECGCTFTFSAQDQEFFKTKGYQNEPKRCPSCRQARRTTRTGGNSSFSSGPRQMFTATCAECGKEAQVPFEPRGDKPVYCSDCYRKVRANR